MAAAGAAAFAMTSCDEQTPVSSACSSGYCPPKTFIVARLGFVVHEPDRTIRGFNLDGAVTTGDFTDGSGCGLRDKVSPDGEVGIDNNLAGLFEFIINLTGDAVDGLIQTAINQGTILVLMRVEGMDDPVNDDHVEVRILKGLDSPEQPPQLATTGFIAPSQTFEVDPSVPEGRGRGHIEDGVLTVGPFDTVEIPVRFFQVSAVFTVHDAYLRGTLMPDGRLAGAVLGGGIELAEIYDIANVAGSMDHNAGMIASAAPAFLEPLADLAFNGNDACEQISTAIALEGEPAYIFGDEP